MKQVLCAADAREKFRASMIAALVCAMALSGPAMAAPDPAAGARAASGASTPAKGGGELDEIVVTAEKRESTVQATAISMTALSGADLSMQYISSLEDLVGKAAGLSIPRAR